jgi:glucose-1-phosphate thymidylyltransferase
MKGILLAGGKGSRLYPATKGVSKQLLPIYDKPMIYYSLTILMLANIRDILIITTEEDQQSYVRLLGDGRQIGLSISYCVQRNPRGIAEAFILGKEFIGSDSVALVLGDNIIYGNQISKILSEAAELQTGAHVFGYYVNNPSAYGVLEFNDNNRVLSIEEKPEHPKSNYAVPGIYFYDNSVVGIAAGLAPSERGELEITDVNQEYLKREQLTVTTFGRGIAWLDTGTCESMMDASNFVAAIQNRQGLMISCIEEIAFKKGYIGIDKLDELAVTMKATSYGQYLRELVIRNS